MLLPANWEVIDNRMAKKNDVMKLIHGSCIIIILIGWIKFRKEICNLNKNNMINDDGQIRKQAFTWSE